MKVFLAVCLFGAVCDVIFAGMAFPSGLPYFVEDEFRKINSDIRWDEKNYLVDISGTYTLCSKVGLNNAFDVGNNRLLSKLYGEEGVGGLAADTQSSGGSSRAAAKDIKTIISQWIYKEPFRSQIREAKSFGCSVQPLCRGRTVVGCLFTPKGRYNPGDDWKTGGGKANVVAFTSDEYRITENNFRRLNPKIVWDRSHFLENLSGNVTQCAMIGRNSWNYQKARDTAAEYGYRVGLLFGYAKKSGVTDDDVRAITVSWLYTDEGRKQVTAAKKVGCSLIQVCPHGTTVIACLVTPGV
ncbi:uncharacterized protein LOC141910156 [Tubulanus polymorphus]|uniref:uncharacterized protein LOC141910156 n=1 Tax=Tubulanus polymorphus TaxID=672921 RepID=UPI003DA51A59